MDRRYSQTRDASDGPISRAKALARGYLAKAKSAARSANSYGGSTGGSRSIGSAAEVSSARGKAIEKVREVSRRFGAEALAKGYGARSAAAEARGYRPAAEQGGERPEAARADLERFPQVS